MGSVGSNPTPLRQIKANMELPKRIIRLDDGEIFILNENGTYSLKEMIPFREKGHLINEYSYDRLMNDPRSVGKFKTI